MTPSPEPVSPATGHASRGFRRLLAPSVPSRGAPSTASPHPEDVEDGRADMSVLDTLAGPLTQRLTAGRGGRQSQAWTSEPEPVVPSRCPRSCHQRSRPGGSRWKQGHLWPHIWLLLLLPLPHGHPPQQSQARSPLGGGGAPVALQRGQLTLRPLPGSRAGVGGS